jgi:hypothetical protein
MRARTLSCIAALILSLSTSTAWAQIDRGDRQLRLSTSVLHYLGGTVEDDDGDEEDFDNLVFGLGQPSLGIGLAFVVVDGLSVGFEVAMGYHWSDEADISVFAFELLGTVEYAFLDGRIRPYVDGVLGMTGEAGEAELLWYTEDSWWVAFQVGAGGGVHFFVADAVSLDLGVLFSLGVGGGEIDLGDFDVDFSVLAFDFDMNFGVSGWF